jgi:hypothetical protein
LTVGTAGSEEDTTASFRAPLFFGWSTTVVVVVVDSSSFLQGIQILFFWLLTKCEEEESV